MDRIRRFLVGLVILGGYATGWAPAVAALPETIDAVRPSLVIVGTFQRTRNPAFRPLGTGFAVADGTLVASNAHVLPADLDAEQLETLAIAVPRTGKVEVREAVKLVADPAHDLALVRIKGSALPALRLGDAASVREGQSVAFSGFPIATVLGWFSVTHQGIIASISPIGVPGARANQLDPRLVKQLAAGAFNIFQLDAPAYPGHSGSPVYLPESGEVIAIINSTFIKGTKESALTAPSGISYAIPVRHLQDLLRSVGSP